MAAFPLLSGQHGYTDRPGYVGGDTGDAVEKGFALMDDAIGRGLEAANVGVNAATRVAGGAATIGTRVTERIGVTAATRKVGEVATKVSGALRAQVTTKLQIEPPREAPMLAERAFDPRRPHKDLQKAAPKLDVDDVDWDRPLTDWLEQKEAEQAQKEEEQAQAESQAGQEPHDRPIETRDDMVSLIMNKPTIPPTAMCRSCPPRLKIRWVLEFNLAARHAAQDQQTLTNMHEPWSMCIRLWDEGLHVGHKLSTDKSTLYILVGASGKVLEKEAKMIQLGMRLKDYKGCVPYAPELVSRMVDTPNGTSFHSSHEQQLVMSLINRALVVPLEVRRLMPSSGWMTDRLEEKILNKIHVSSRFLRDLLTTFGANVEDQAEKIGPQTLKTCKLVIFDPYFHVEPVEEGGHHNILDIAESAVGTAVESAKAVGKTSRLVIQRTVGKGESSTLDKQDMLRRQKEKYSVHTQKPMVWADCQTLFVELSTWLANDGQTERFIGLLHRYWPTHDCKT